MEIRPKETPQHQRDSFGRALAQAVQRQFEKPETAEAFQRWLKEREQKGAHAHA